MKDFEKVALLGASIYALYRIGSDFGTQFQKVEKGNPNLLDILVLAGLGITFLNRLDSTASQTRALLA